MERVRRVELPTLCLASMDGEKSRNEAKQLFSLISRLNRWRFYSASPPECFPNLPSLSVYHT